MNALIQGLRSTIVCLAHKNRVSLMLVHRVLLRLHTHSRISLSLANYCTFLSPYLAVKYKISPVTGEIPSSEIVSKVTSSSGMPDWVRTSGLQSRSLIIFI